MRPAERRDSRSRSGSPGRLVADLRLRLEVALQPALIASLSLFALAALAGLVRLLPWLLDPRVPLRTAWPFARALLGLAAEAAIVVGWPVGWALSAARRIERGEAKLFALLGERPSHAAARLVPEALVLSLALGAVSLAGGADARAPGRVVDSLLAQGRTACAHATTPTAYAVPLANATWLCRPGTDDPVRIALDASAFFGGNAPPLTALSADVAGDLRSVELTDARAASFRKPATDADASTSPRPFLTLHANHVHLRGLPPFARASSLPTGERALLMILTALVAAFASVERLLKRGQGPGQASAAPGLWWTLALGGAGPLAGLGVLRMLETRDSSPVAFVLVPLAAFVAAMAAPAVGRTVDRIARLPSSNRAATT